LERYLVGDAGRYQTILPGKHRVLAAGQLWQNEAKKGNVFKVDKTRTWLPARLALMVLGYAHAQPADHGQPTPPRTARCPRTA
jgi:hypothetical protein